MARRRLNKKVALIGSAVFAVVALVSILVILQFSRDAQEYITDAQAALKAAHEANNPQIKKQNYDRAERNLRAAYVKAKDNILREEILYTMLDMYLETQEWPFIMACWDEIININSNNARARYGRIRYLHILGKSGTSGVWQRVCEEATEFLKIAEEQGLLMEKITQWNVPGIEQDGDSQQYLGPYLHLLRGIGSLEMASSGAATNRDEMLAQAINDIKAAQELEPGNIDTYWHLARAVIARGEILASRGNFEEKDKSIEQARDFLEQAVKISATNPKAHLNLLQFKLILARDNSSGQQNERIRSLESDYLSLANKFSTSADVFAAISEYYLIYSKYSGPGSSLDNLNNAIEAIEKAMSLDESNVVYAINAADLYYRRSSVFGQQADIYKAMDIAKKALTLPEAQDSPGPQHQIRIVNRFQLYAFLANCYVEQILDSQSQKTESEIKTLLSETEQAVQEIEQILGSKEEPLTIKWRGMLELAGGNQKSALQNLNTAYEQLKALKPSTTAWPKDLEFANLSYRLAKIFKDTPEIGAVKEFLISALHSGIADIKPESRLDYVEVAMELNPWTEVIQHIDAFEKYYGPNKRSRNLRIKTYIRAMRFDDAEKELAKEPSSESETIQLRLALVQARIRQAQLAIAQKRKQYTSILQPTGLNDTKPVDLQVGEEQYMTKELIGYKQLETKLSEQLLATEPNAVGQNILISTCRNYITQGNINQAKDFINRYLNYFPENITALVYKQILFEPQPKEVSIQRYRDIEEKVLLNLTDPFYSSLELGIFYHRNNEYDKAIVQFTKAIEKGTSTDHTSGDSVFKRIKLAADFLFDMSLAKNNWKPAEQVIKTAKDEDLDGCHGIVYESRMAAAKGEFDKALSKIDECLKQKPIFSQAYLLRSNINAALGNDAASLEDIRKAASLNPLDITIAKKEATTLYYRNQKLGDNVLPNQVAETRKALERAIGLNLFDLELLNLYAEFIAPTEPLRAVAIRQDVLQASPTVENATLLGKLAMEVALKQINTESKEALLDIAGSAFEQAQKISPKDKRMLYYYAEYFRVRGMENEAKKLLTESQDDQLLWNYYFKLGRYENAMKVLEHAYKQNPKDTGILRGLIQVAEKTADQESVKKYSGELLSLEDTVENHLTQVQAFLQTGLTSEAERALQSIKGKYPNESRIMLLEAWLLLKQGQLEKALELTDRNLQSDKNNAVAWRLRGEINIKLANYDKAISDLRHSKLLSDDPVIRVSLARAYMNAKRYEDAITELISTIADSSAPQEVGLLLEYIYTQLDRKEALNRFYQDTLEKFPDNTQWLNRAGAYALRTGQYDKAEQLYQKACQIKIQENPGLNPEELAKDVTYATSLDGYLKTLLMAAGESNTNNWNPAKVGKVLEECQKYINTSFSPVAYLRMAEANYKLGNKTKTSEYCRKAIDQTGTNEVLASEVLMRMFLMLGADEVSAYCEQKLRTDPDSIAANFVMFNLVGIKGEYIKALDYINKCIELTGPENPNRVNYIIKKVDVLIQAYEQTSDNKYIKTAITDYESLLAEMPKNINVLNNFAYLLTEYSQRYPEALKYAGQALDEKPNDPGIMDTYAYALHKNDKNLEAAEYVEAALQQYSQQNIISVPPEVYEHKGMIQEKLGANDEALAAYRTALESGADKFSNRVRERITRAIERVSP